MDDKPDDDEIDDGFDDPLGRSRRRFVEGPVSRNMCRQRSQDHYVHNEWIRKSAHRPTRIAKRYQVIHALHQNGPREMIPGQLPPACSPKFTRHKILPLALNFSHNLEPMRAAAKCSAYESLKICTSFPLSKAVCMIDARNRFFRKADTREACWKDEWIAGIDNYFLPDAWKPRRLPLFNFLNSITSPNRALRRGWIDANRPGHGRERKSHSVRA